MSTLNYVDGDSCMSEILSKKEKLIKQLQANRSSYLIRFEGGDVYYDLSLQLWRSNQLLNRELIHSVTSVSLLLPEEVTASDMIRKYLRPSTFRNYMSIFELFLVDVIKIWLSHYPDILGKSQLSFQQFLDSTSRETLISDVIEKEVIDILYKDTKAFIKSLYSYLGKNSSACSLSDDDINKLSELKALRNIHEHNNGIINKIYLEKSRTLTRGQEGTFVEIDDDILSECMNLLKTIMQKITDDFVNHLK